MELDTDNYNDEDTIIDDDDGYLDEDLTLEDICCLHEKNYVANSDTRRRAAADRVFSWYSQWSDDLLADSQNAYRGEFNVLRKATRQIIADLRANPVQVDFVPLDDSREDGAEILDGLYLTDDRRNSSLEAYDNASLECVDCGLGGWELINEYETNRAGDKHQVIRRYPLYEANNNSFPDANAKALDKSDAMNWSVLVPYTVDGYKRLYKELTGETTECSPSSFAFPEQSYTFPWINGNVDQVYIVRFYHKTLIKDTVLTMTDPMGNPVKVLESSLTEIMDELIDEGYEITDSKEIKRYCVKRYICSGEKILKVEDVPGEWIPVVHTYGERTFIEGEEYWEGVVRLAKDPQRLRNFMLSYLTEIVSRSPRPKPIFDPRQIAGHEAMYAENGADNNYPYYLRNGVGPNGEDLSTTPIEYLSSPGLPQGMQELIAETREAVKDVADPGLPDQFADPDMSGYAMEIVQARFDQQSIVYQQNMKFAKRYDAQVYASMASSVYDTPRKVTITKPDGSRKTVEIMQTVLDEESGNLIVLNDLTNAEFEVFAEIGKSYTTKKEKTRDELGRLAEQFAALDPKVATALNMQRVLLMDGVALDGFRDYFRKQLLLTGFREPEDEEDEALLEQQAQQTEQPDPEMVYAMAEQGKAQAAQMREQRLAQLDQFTAQNKDGELQVKAYSAETDRMNVQVNAQKAGADIELTRAKIPNTQADTFKKIRESYGARVSGPRF